MTNGKELKANDLGKVNGGYKEFNELREQYRGVPLNRLLNNSDIGHNFFVDDINDMCGVFTLKGFDGDQAIVHYALSDGEYRDTDFCLPNIGVGFCTVKNA